jgi:hypothetical protein
MTLSTRSLFSRRRFVVTAVLSALVLCKEQHQTEAFSSSPLLSIRRSTCTTANSRVGHGHSPWNSNSNSNSNGNDNSSPRQSRTFLSVSSRPVINGEQLTTQGAGTGTDAVTAIPVTFNSDNDIHMDAERDESDRIAKEEFNKGFRIIGFITLLNASLAPVWCVLYSGIWIGYCIDI